ncbi:MAG: hypothetical protein HDR71_19785 [Lachnospiraceae bacterium]|nr:hypothetical protein [Lachnospiraceae bacterium]
MRKEASLEQWRVLYGAATRIKELKPWEKFWDMNLTAEYAMFNQRNLTCYWGNRDELTDKQRKIIKDLGYSYRGKNQWLYFLSFEPGYYPYNLDSEEVVRLSEYFQDLELALKDYNDVNMKVDFEHGNMLLLSFDKDKKTRNFGEAPLPFTSFQFGNLLITDEELLVDLAEAPKSSAVLEADISAMGARIDDKKYSRPANPALVLLGDAESEMIINFEMAEPDDDPNIILAEMVIHFIFQYGAPKEIRVTNIIVEACLEQICDVCGIKLRRVKRLHGLDSFIKGMGRFGL